MERGKRGVVRFSRIMDRIEGGYRGGDLIFSREEALDAAKRAL